MAPQDKTPRKEDNGWLRGGEMDYDQMLSHYQGETQEEEAPSKESREKKAFLRSLISDVKSEGKFTKKKGTKAVPVEEASAQDTPSGKREEEAHAAPASRKAAQAKEAEGKKAAEQQKPAASMKAQEQQPVSSRKAEQPKAPGKVEKEVPQEPSWQSVMEAYLSRAQHPEQADVPAAGEETKKEAPGHSGAPVEKREKAPLNLEELQPAPKDSGSPERWDKILNTWPEEKAETPVEDPGLKQALQSVEEMEVSGGKVGTPSAQGEKQKKKSSGKTRKGTEKKAVVLEQEEKAPEPSKAPEPERESPSEPEAAPQKEKKETLGARLGRLLKSTKAPGGDAGEESLHEELSQETIETKKERRHSGGTENKVEKAAPASSGKNAPKNPKKASGKKPAGEGKKKAAASAKPAAHSKESSKQEEAEAGHRSPTPWEWFYIEIYYIGIQLMRDVHLMRREAAKGISWLAHAVPSWLMEQRRKFLRICDRISDKTLFPYREIARRTGQLYHSLKSVGRRKGSFRIRIEIWKEYFGAISRPLNHIANFVAPIVGITILAATVNYFTGLNYALSVEYSGQNLGYIAKESVFYDAQQSVLDRMINEEYLAPENAGLPTFRIVIADEEDLIDQETLANRIITISQNEVQEADGVYIEGAFLGALEDGNEFLMYIDNILETYRTGIEHELVQFVKNITVRRGIYPKSSVVPLSQITNDMESEETRSVEHTVEEGDTLTQIAEDNNTTVEQLMLLNPDLEERLPEGSEDETVDGDSVPLREGEVLTVAKVNLSLGVQVTRRETYTEDIPYGTTTVEDNRYYKGYQVTISAGINGKQEVTADVTYIDGEKVGENRIGTPVVLQEPVNAQVLVGTLPILTYLPSGGSSSDSFMWPVKGGYMSAGLYGYAGHTGMDIAAPAGTEIRAAKDGQVTYATNYSIWPYGKRVDISHGDGVMTRYAHCSAVFVTAGQYVRQGDLIALVGRTGNATGNHCHFEIKINGVIMNPANFIGTYWPGY